MCWDAQGEVNLGPGNEEWLESLIIPDSIRGTTKITLLSAMFSTIEEVKDYNLVPSFFIGDEKGMVVVHRVASVPVVVNE